jgi:hypothetical protein
MVSLNFASWNRVAPGCELWMNSGVRLEEPSPVMVGSASALGRAWGECCELPTEVEVGEVRCYIELL